MGTNEHGDSTISVHGGETRRKFAGALTNPIAQTSTFVFENMAEVVEYATKKLDGIVTRFEYGRYGNPTEAVAAQKIAELEGGEACVLTASGMAAVTACLMTYLKQGDHMIVTQECYRKTRELCRGVLAKFGVEHDVVPEDDVAKLAALIRPNTKVVFSESPTNPRLKVVDIRSFVDTVRKHSDAVLMIDSTFATPVNQRPLEFGVDVVIHSCTKYFGGHNDLLAGAIVSDKKRIAEINATHGTFGACIDPHCAYLLIRGLKTLALRVARCNENGQAVADFLQSHPKVRKVYYPGLPSHPNHELAKKQMKGFGGVVSFEIDGSTEETYRFVDAVSIPYIGPSLGGVESLIYHPAALTFADCSPEERAGLGMMDQLVRLSVGIEDAADLIADLDQALRAIS